MYEFKMLFTPIRVGNLTLTNRIASTAHVPGFADKGYPTEQYCRYHAEKARGGVGLTITGGSASVHPTSPAAEWRLVANRDDSIIPYYRKLVDAVHEHNAAIFMQITHLGRRGRSDSEGWLPLVAPSQIPDEVLVRVHAAAITRGELSWPANRLPAIPSYEFSGVVAGVGRAFPA